MKEDKKSKKPKDVLKGPRRKADKDEETSFEAKKKPKSKSRPKKERS